jgi:hypothetical protein
MPVIGQYPAAQPGQLVDELLVLAWGGLDIEVYPVLGEFGVRYYLEPDRWPVPVWVYQVGGTFGRSPVDVAEHGAPEGTKQLRVLSVDADFEVACRHLSDDSRTDSGQDVASGRSANVP